MNILVTGATSGFGLAIARRFAQTGHKVVVAGRRRERLQALVDELGDQMVHALELDVRDRRAVEDAVAGLPAAFAAIDVLVNNAASPSGSNPRRRPTSTAGRRWSTPTSRA